MKRLLLLILVSLLIAGAIGGLVLQEPGYILISYGDYTLETSVWIGAVLTLVLVITLYFSLWLLRRLLGAGSTAKQWHQGYKRRRIRAKTNQGMVHLMEGNWKQAQKQLTHSAPEADTPLPIYLAAARAAANNDDVSASEELLREAHAVTPSGEVAISLTKAELEIEREQYEQALATLLHLYKLNPKHKHVLQLLQRVYLVLEDWEGLKQIMPALRKHKVVQPQQLDELEEKLSLTLLKQAASPRDGVNQAQQTEQLNQVWQGFSKPLRQHPELVQAYARHLHVLEAAQHAEQAVRDALQQNWQAELVLAYGLIPADKADKQLQYAEAWLKQHPDDPELLLSLGRIALRNKLWGRARDYFLGSCKLKASPQACAELSRLLRHMGEFEQSHDYTQRGFASVVNNLPELPMPS